MVKGSCLCGGVIFEINGQLTPIQYCHALRCRKATGGAFSPELLTEKKGFRWIMGEHLIKIYTAPIIKEAPAYKKAFCTNCGSPLPVDIEGTDFILFQAGVLDNDPTSRPFRHAFTGQKACWHEITDSLPLFEEQPPVPDKYK